jgi:hypothetical protein
MSLVSALIQEFQAETAITRGVLERVPDDRLTWTPSEIDDGRRTCAACRL